MISLNLKHALAAIAAGAFAFLAQAQEKPVQLDKPLYGVAYYSEYTPTDRLDEDIRLMKEAGVTVVRVGESTWSLFEPQDGVFEFAWMDRIIDAMYNAGIKVILGTPTYSIPSWLAAEHPEVMGITVGQKPNFYGIRQNADFYNATYRRYSERIIRKMMEHYAAHPAIIGYQLDNELEARGIDNRDYFEGFRDYVKEKFHGDLPLLNRTWGLNYWGMNINKWEDFYDRSGVTNPSYKLEWERWNRKATADFLNWQADIVNEYKKPGQFVTHCFMLGWEKIDQDDASRQMDYPSYNIYYDTQDAQDGVAVSYSSDRARMVSRTGNFLITETDAQTEGWDSKKQLPPYDGQLRQNMYGFFASGADMVEYWHWASIHYGQEVYWKGIISHDGLSGRVYGEFASNAAELEKIGSKIVGLQKHNETALLFSADSKQGLGFMPYRDGENYNDWELYRSLYRQNIECDVIMAEKNPDLSKYRLLVIPSLYVASDELLAKITEFVKNGGQVLMMYKSGFCDHNSMVRPTLMPGPLKDVCGFTYQEFSTIGTQQLAQNPMGVKDNTVNTWTEFLEPTTAKVIGRIDHPFFGRWACITDNHYGKGDLLYLGANPSTDLLDSLVAKAAERAGVKPDHGETFPIIIRNGVNREGNRIHYVFNYSGSEKNVSWPFGKGVDILSGKKYRKGASMELAPWGVTIVEEQ